MFMKKTIILMSVLLAWATSLPAQITREQADEIVINYLNSEVGPLSSFLLYVNADTPNEGGFSVTTSNGETVKAKYACWVYCEERILLGPFPALMPPPPPLYRYLFVKEDNGSLLEIISKNDLGPADLNTWTVVNVPSGIVAPKENNKSLYPNPVNDLLTLPCNGESTRVEIYDLKGTRLFAGTLSGEDACRLDVSFLSAGVYMVKVGGEKYKIIKN